MLMAATIRDLRRAGLPKRVLTNAERLAAGREGPCVMLAPKTSATIAANRQQDDDYMV